MEQAFTTSGVRKEILSIALPSFFEALFTSFTAIIDSKMVSGLGVAAISSISVTNQPKMFVYSVFFAINTVAAILVAQNVGKKDKAEANSVYLLSLMLSAALSLLLGILCAFFAVPIMQLCSGQADTLADSVTYFRIIMLSMVFENLFSLNSAAFRGCGKTNLTFLSHVIASCVNIVGNYLLIEGHCGFPALGIFGAAVATAFGSFSALIFTFIYMHCTPDAFVSLKYCILNRLRVTRDIFFSVFSLWKHVVIENLLTRLGFLITSGITARIGSFSMSVYSVGQHLMNVNFALGNGLQSAAIALVGRSCGEKDNEKIRIYSKRLLCYGLISSAALSALIFLISNLYGRLFSADAEFIRQTAIVCYIIAVISPIQTVKLIYTGLLQGVGNARSTKIAAVISVTLTQSVVNYLLTIRFGFGLWGAWGSIFVSQATWLLTLYLFYRRSTKQLFRAAG